MHEDERVQFLCLGPERIEIFAVIVAMIDVGGDVSAAKPELVDRVFQDFCRARLLLYRHRGHRGKALGVFLDEFVDAVIVDATPALGLVPLEIIAEQLRARIKRR